MDISKLAAWVKDFGFSAVVAFVLLWSTIENQNKNSETLTVLQISLTRIESTLQRYCVPTGPR
jgi:hypothetical protein